MRIKAPVSQKNWKERWRINAKRYWRSIIMLDDTPHRIAWGVAIGTLIAWQPIMGAQMIVASIVAWVLRGNVMAALPMVWMSNPATFVPFYYFTYWLGAICLSIELKGIEEISQLWSKITELGLIDGTIELVTDFGKTVFYPMILGGTIVGVANGILFYVLTQWGVRVYQRRKGQLRRSWSTQLPGSMDKGQ